MKCLGAVKKRSTKRRLVMLKRYKSGDESKQELRGAAIRVEWLKKVRMTGGPTTEGSS